MEKQGKIYIRQIFKDHWPMWWAQRQGDIPEEMRDSVFEAVAKMLGCGDPKNGYIKYRCVSSILNVSHRHTVFTIPEELRGKFYWHRELLDDMCDRVAAVIQAWYRGERKKGKVTAPSKKQPGNEVGVIAVVHTFGRDMKFNPHIHALVTEGALTPSGRWKPVNTSPMLICARHGKSCSST